MEKWSVEKYCDRLQAMKCEAHDKLWLYIEVNAKEFMNECEPGVKNLNSCCKAMLNKMLEGDNFVVEPKSRSKCAGTLTIRYYVDNLSPERRTYAQAMADNK